MFVSIRLCASCVYIQSTLRACTQTDGARVQAREPAVIKRSIAAHSAGPSSAHRGLICMDMCGNQNKDQYYVLWHPMRQTEMVEAQEGSGF